MTGAGDGRSGADVLTIDPDVKTEYGDVAVAYLTLSELTVGATPPRLKKLARRAEAGLREAARDSWPSPNLERWERLARAMGLSEIADLPAPRALAEQVIGGRNMPKINFVVDAANVTALRFQTPVGTFDLDRLSAPLRLRLAGDREAMTPILATRAVECAAKEIVYGDSERVFSRYSRDADFSKITEETRRVLCVVDGAPGMPADYLLEGANSLAEVLRDVANAELRIDGPHIAPVAADARPAAGGTEDP